MSEKTDPKTIALSYLDATGRKDYAAVDALLAPNVVFRGPVATLEGAENVAAGYRHVSSFLVRNHLRKAFVDGNDVCLVYDYVTDTAVGPVPTMEWVTIENGKIRSIVLLTDHVRWPKALEEAKRRTA